MKRIQTVICLLVAARAAGAAESSIRVADRPDTTQRNLSYVSNRAPLAPSPLINVPIGSIHPEGWLRKQLELQAAGFHGHLGEISTFLHKDGNSWLDARGHGEHGWEEVPYWLKGYLNCGYVLGDERMIAEAQVWIEGALASQQEDGWFGPDGERTGVATKLKGRDDLWPNTIMLFCLRDYYSAHWRRACPSLMSKYFRYLETVPEDQYLLGYWPKMRGGDLLDGIYWLYNRTGEPWLLEVAAKNHRRTARWDQEVVNWHNVNIAGISRSATWWMQSRNDADLQATERVWQEVRGRYGQVPGGMWGGDENSRDGCDDPRQAIETCGVVETMLSDELLVGITGDLKWADRCEEAAYNTFPATSTADMTGLRYLTAPNQAVSDAKNHAPGIQNGGPMFEMNPHGHRCCQHNCGHGWPYLAEHLWYATADNGLAAIFYNDCTVTANVVDGRRVTIDQDTRYPFDDIIIFELTVDQPVKFPLYLRVPGWCDTPRLELNGEDAPVEARPRQFIVIDRTWNNGDKVRLTLPMRLKVRVWESNHDSVSVQRGPLTFSLKIEERYSRSGGTDQWPAHEIFPASPWNYGLRVNSQSPDASFAVELRDWPPDDMPWVASNVPVTLIAQGKRIPAWKLDQYGLVAPLQDSPVKSDQPVEDITLIPMGAARLRISAFPVIGDGANARQWTPPPVLLPPARDGP